MIDQLNQMALDRLQRLESCAHRLRIAFLEEGRVADFGVNMCGGLEAGLELARICLGGLGVINLLQSDDQPVIQVFTDQPALACMGSQYGGWPVRTDDYFAIGSGPMRLHRGKEPVLDKYGFAAHSREIVGVLESGQLPNEDVIRYMADECEIDPSRIFLCVAPTRSLAGTIQIVARSVEATMHKLFELDVDLRKVTSGLGTAPLPPVSADDLIAIGRTNDAILYGGCVTLWVDMNDDEIERIGPETPSNSSSEFGKPFGEIFAVSGGDFYQLDPMLFSAAQVTFVSNESGKMFRFGETRLDIVRAAGR
ncbi:MAG: methenyltetrahydromethanopterin cyclohydrolase [Pirellulaceae bacterium]